MSIFGNSNSISRYKVETSLPLLGSEVNMETCKKALAHLGFRSIVEGAEEVSVGWVQINDQEAASFENPDYLQIGDFIVFSLRRDVRVIPPLILFGEIKKEMDIFLAEHPNFRSVPKPKRTEIKENVKLKLLSRQLPDSQVWDVVWDVKDKMIYLFNTSAKAMEVFELMFKRTFTPFSLIYYTPWHQAEEIAGPLELSYDLKEKNLANSRGVLDLIKSNVWLGRDFLLWILSGNGQAACAGLSAWVDCKIDMASALPEGGIEKITVTGSQHEMPVIKSALKGGAYLTKAGIFFEDNDGAAYSFVLTGETFAISQMKTPTVKLEQSEDSVSEYQGAFLDKMGMIQKGLTYLEKLLGEYLKVRVTYQWDSERRKINDWMEE
ncbi:MAG TPA: hypothetical protein DCS09_06085 [Porphyromonadaceae bacterium]|nr:hypothetical protein [Porphyromonadaceae bacterium]